MSSKKESPVESIAQLNFVHKGKNKEAQDDKIIVRTVRQDHGYPKITFPKAFIALGMKLNQEVVIEKKGSNPLNFEIVIKPLSSQSLKGIEDGQGNK